MSDIYAARRRAAKNQGRIYATPTLPSARLNPVAVIPAINADRGGIARNPGTLFLNFPFSLYRFSWPSCNSVSPSALDSGMRRNDEQRRRSIPSKERGFSCPPDKGGVEKAGIRTL